MCYLKKDNFFVYVADIRCCVVGFFCCFFQVVLVTQYWTKYNLVSIFASVGFYFLCTKITQSLFLFRRSPADYPFIGTDLPICCIVYGSISTEIIFQIQR